MRETGKERGEGIENKGGQKVGREGEVVTVDEEGEGEGRERREGRES